MYPGTQIWTIEKKVNHIIDLKFTIDPCSALGDHENSAIMPINPITHITNQELQCEPQIGRQHTYWKTMEGEGGQNS